MRKAIVIILLAVLSGNAAAEWVRVGGSSTAASYADRATIRSTGNLVKMWGLLNFASAQESPVDQSKNYLSEKTLLEFDCQGYRARMLSYSLHSENMRSGEVVYSNSDPEKWARIPPATAMAHARNFACLKQ